jgi:hypothetical protein
MIKKLFFGCFVMGILLTVAGGGAAWYFFVRELPQLTASVDLPPLAEVGQPVTMVIHLTNPHAKAVSLDSIDIDDTFLVGVEVLADQPEPTGPTELWGQKSWEFLKEVPPGDTLTVRFELRPLAAGTFSGDVDVCNNNQDFTTLTATLNVQDSSAGQSIP